MSLETLDKNHDDHHQNPNHKSIEISFQEDSVAVSDTLAHPITVMAEPFAAKVAYLTVVDCVVDQRAANRTPTLIFALDLLRTGPVRLYFSLSVS